LPERNPDQCVGVFYCIFHNESGFDPAHPIRRKSHVADCITPPLELSEDTPGTVPPSENKFGNVIKSFYLYIMKRKPEDFFPFFNKEISFEDNRSKTMPRKGKGIVIGIRTDSVELRVNNNISQWYPINSLNMIYYLEMS
jgi:hypothetical protein